MPALLEQISATYTSLRPATLHNLRRKNWNILNMESSSLYLLILSDLIKKSLASHTHKQIPRISGNKPLTCLYTETVHGPYMHGTEQSTSCSSISYMIRLTHRPGSRQVRPIQILAHAHVFKHQIFWRNETKLWHNIVE
jgi:hypothetical protein